MSLTTSINRYPTSTWVFCAMWLLIGFISSYDTYLSALNEEYLYELEENPMARYFIAKYSVPAFIGFKMFGTVLTLGCIVLLYHTHKATAWVVNTSIFAVQMALFLYLINYVV